MVSLNNSSFESCFFIVATYFSRRSLHKKTIRCSDTCMSFLIRKVVLTYVQCLLPLRFGFGFCWSWNSNYDCFMFEQVQAAIMCTSSKIHHILRWLEVNSAIACRAKWCEGNQETSHSHIQSWCSKATSTQATSTIPRFSNGIQSCALSLLQIGEGTSVRLISQLQSHFLTERHSMRTLKRLTTRSFCMLLIPVIVGNSSQRCVRI